MLATYFFGFVAVVVVAMLWGFGRALDSIATSLERTADAQEEVKNALWQIEQGLK